MNQPATVHLTARPQIIHFREEHGNLPRLYDECERVNRVSGWIKQALPHQQEETTLSPRSQGQSGCPRPAQTRTKRGASVVTRRNQAAAQRSAGQASKPAASSTKRAKRAIAAHSKQQPNPPPGRKPPPQQRRPRRRAGLFPDETAGYVRRMQKLEPNAALGIGMKSHML